MKIELTIPDDVIDAYKNDQGQVTRQAFVSQLERFQHVKVMDRIIIVGPVVRDRLELLFGSGHLKDDADLLARVLKLGSLRIGSIDIDFTIGEWEEIAHRAVRNTPHTDGVPAWGLSEAVAREVKSILDRMKSEFFNYV